MTALSPEMARLLADAADLRAAGNSWDAVADRLGRSPDTCRRWPARYPAAWTDLYHRAERRQAEEARAEATAILRTQLRAKDDKAQRDAAKALLTSARRRDPAPASATDPISDYISSLPADHVPDVADACRRALAEEAAD